jgi:type I restriction enzyme R subunit
MTPPATPTEYTLVEKPILDTLTSNYGYRYIHPDEHLALRPRENEVLFRPVLLDALVRINGIPLESAKAIYQDLAAISDNQRWVEVLRGNYSRKIPGEETHRTIRVVDFDDLGANELACTNQLRVQGEVVRKPDVVVYLNGIPVVVIEAKSPLNPGQNTFDAIDQIRIYEHDIPRLFHSNLFNIATNDVTFRFGATGAPREGWAGWKDPWPRKPSEFTDATEQGLYALLEPSRLLDILAHFIVFETRKGKTTKKVCRYQQYRAVGKMVQRVIDGQHRQGLIWHTQGSGKSLTMVFAALKLKFHRGIQSERLQNPNLLIVTDRIDLHDQITKTFTACGVSNPITVDKIADLPQIVTPGSLGKTALTTIFKFQAEDDRLQAASVAQRKAALKALEVPGSETWILMVDECHRTQEKDLGAYLQATLPGAVRFGFTGTPVKKNDLDTFQNFGVAGERYLDKYGIDDAVADGATVPIYYMGRMTEWHLHDKEIDILFDQWFAGAPDDVVEELKARGVTKGDLARFAKRIELIAQDIWAHYREHVLPDGYKAQVVAIDREACALYKEALDATIAKSLVTVEGLSEEEAKLRAGEMSLAIYTPGQHDQVQHKKVYKHQVDPDSVTTKVIPVFLDGEKPLRFLIVCNKLLTGFDAPIEQAMYLDNPLTDHNLLQAIARTNRRYGAKDHGLIVDYIGVSKKLGEALSSYRSEDVQAAMRNLDELRDALRVAHREVMELLRGAPRTDDPKGDAKAAVAGLKTEDAWFLFRSKADAFLKAYGSLSPDPAVLLYSADLRYIATVLVYGRLLFENAEEVDWKVYSEKIRAMLDEHLEVTGLKTVCKLRSLSDPGFWDDFHTRPEDLQTAAVRKLAELKKETAERAAKNPARYEKFSDRIKLLIQQFNQGLANAAMIMQETDDVAQALVTEDQAFQGSGLNARAYDIYKILESHVPGPAGAVAEGPTEPYGGEKGGGQPKAPSALHQVAAEIDDLYASEATAPPLWQQKTQLKKELRQIVRKMLMPLKLEGWQLQIPQDIEVYAVQRYAKD